MQPAIQGVRENVRDFLDGIESDGQMSWDVRFDFLAYQVSEDTDGLISSLYTVNKSISGLFDSLYQGNGEGLFGLERVPLQGDEFTLMALDCAMDFPWRTVEGCRRIVIVMTDEPLETGAQVERSRELMPKVIDKLQRLKIMLFVFAPQSDMLHSLDQVSRSVWELVENGRGLADIDLGQSLRRIAKSISTSQTPLGSLPDVPRALFGQDTWGSVQDRPLKGS